MRHGVGEYNEALEDYNEGKAEFDASLEESGMTVDGLYESRDQLESAIDMVGGAGGDT